MSQLTQLFPDKSPQESREFILDSVIFNGTHWVAINESGTRVLGQFDSKKEAILAVLKLSLEKTNLSELYRGSENVI
jgi:hypothetical protein